MKLTAFESEGHEIQNHGLIQMLLVWYSYSAIRLCTADEGEVAQLVVVFDPRGCQSHWSSPSLPGRVAAASDLAMYRGNHFPYSNNVKNEINI